VAGPVFPGGGGVRSCLGVVSAINPGSDPLEAGTLDAAEANLPVFVEECRAGGAELGDPIPDESVDDGGRFGRRLPHPHGEVLLLMPGAPPLVRDDPSVQAPCLRVGDNFCGGSRRSVRW
jgi:hypothetical protein